MPSRTNQDYVTLAELKSYLRITDTADDTVLALAITAASRAVDLATNRAFGVDDPAIARVYTYDGRKVPTSQSLFHERRALEVEDISSTVGLMVKLDEDDNGSFEKTLVLDTDYRLWPYNAAADGRPFERLVMTSSTSSVFPVHLRGIEVTAKFGWASVPSAIKQAVLLQAGRIFSRRNAPFGVVGSPDLGSSELRLLARLDPDVAVLVSSFRRYWAAVA